MKLLDRVLDTAWGSLRADTGNVSVAADSDFWYTAFGFQTATGLRVSPESAMRLASVFACVRVISESVASLPLLIYKRLPGGGREIAYDHPYFRLLNRQPNEWQTSFEFFEMIQGHLELRGNSYARIIPGRNRAAEQLIPLHPDRVEVRRNDGGRLQYKIRYGADPVVILAQDEIVHWRGMSSDGISGFSTITVGAETIATGLAAAEFAARFFQNDSTPSAVMMHPKTLTETAQTRLKASFRNQHNGPNAHSLAILEEGMSYQNIGLTNKDSQLLEARAFSRTDVASMFRMPPHKIGDLSRANFTNIEQQNIEFATDTVRPRLERLEARIDMDLLDPLDESLGGDYFCKFSIDELLRGDLKSRYEAYSVGINAGFLMRNEARAREDYNPKPGLDRPIMPLNTAVVDDTGMPLLPEHPSDQPPSGAVDSNAVSEARLNLYVQEAASRVVRKEVKFLRQIDKQANGDFSKQVADFYASHRDFVASTMHISVDAATGYALWNSGIVTANRERGIDSIEAASAEVLVDLALEKRRKEQ